MKRKVITRFDGIPYLIRYTLFTCRWLSIKVHRIILSDDACLHDHPWAFVSIILWNGYIEHSEKKKIVGMGIKSVDHAKAEMEVYVDEMVKRISKKYRVGNILFRRANFAHRLEVHKPAITLVITFKKVRQWGFFTPRGWTPYYNYKQENQCE